MSAQWYKYYVDCDMKNITATLTTKNSNSSKEYTKSTLLSNKSILMQKHVKQQICNLIISRTKTIQVTNLELATN